jgi:hypothetical protein
MEVWGVEQLRLAVLQPLSSCKTLAFWTVPITACNGEFPLHALWANSVMGSHGRLRPSLLLLPGGFALHYCGIPEQGD